jgi:hypothetical protein
MTVIRLHAGGLFIHSPTPLADGLAAEVERLGTPRWIVGPNRLHYWWIPAWRTAFPTADIYLAPRIREQSAGRIDFQAHDLAADTGYPWDAAVSTLPIMGSYMTEVVFFHHPSRTLVLTDLVENFEPARLGHGLMRWLSWLGGVQDPHGGMPRDMRLTFRRSRPALRAAVERMIAWDPARIVLAHGRWYDRDGAAELRRAFAWLLR